MGEQQNGELKNDRFVAVRRDGTHTRRLELKPHGCRSDVVFISQYSSGKHSALLDEPRVHWGICDVPNGVRHLDSVRNFAAALNHAVEVAELWDKDVGKTMAEVADRDKRGGDA